MKKKIIGVFKTHFDYGYTDLAERVLEHYCTDMLDKAISVCNATRKHGENLMYKWTLPSYLLMQMYDRSEGERREALTSLIMSGQIVCHALPFTLHTELLDKKQLDNLFIFTDEYVKTFGKYFPISAKMTDVPGHTSALIAPLVKRGVKFLHLGKNQASTAPDVPTLFWWQDKFGNRILTMYNKNYGSDILPPKDWKYPVWLALCHTYDNAGVQEDDYVLGVRDFCGEKYDFATGTLDDFARELLKCDLSDIPVISGELGDTWIHGVGSLPKAVSAFRRSRKEFYALEEYAEKLGADISRERDEFYKTALVFCEHTFGANILKYLGQQRAFDKNGFALERENRAAYVILEDSWKEQEAYAGRLNEICKSLKARLGYTAKAEQKSEPISASVKGKDILISFAGKNLAVRYEYRIFGAESIFKYMQKYLVRYFDWSISDFGRNHYPEIGDEIFTATPHISKVSEDSVSVDFALQERSYSEFGNFKKLAAEIKLTDGKLSIKLAGKDKVATPLVECGNLIVKTDSESSDFAVEKCGMEIDVNSDIVKGANQLLFSSDGYARIGNIKLSSLDAPLVSFGENAICRFQATPKSKRKPIFVINLFNNHWGTNFPQWIEGDLSYEVIIEEKC